MIASSTTTVPHAVTSPAPGVISQNEVYRLDEALRRMGWSQAAYRAARRRGLNVLASGKRRYLPGQEIIRFLTADSEAPRHARE